MDSNIENLVLQLYDIKVLKFGNYKLKSGVNSPVYLDLRIIISYPNVMELLTNLLVERIQKAVPKTFQHVCGVPYTALPMATLVSAKTGTPMLIRRKEAKDHGTKKIIEGEYKSGDECIIIEDVVSSGSSIRETIMDLQKESLKASHAIVVLDREQGGVKNLQNEGVNVHILLTISEMLTILFKHQKISKDIVSEVESYISSVKLITKDGNLQKGSDMNRLKMRFSDRAKLSKNKLVTKIFEIVESKQSMLCLAADVTKMAQLFNLASSVGPHICILKTHFDAIEDFSKSSYLELIKLAKNFNFLLMEDRKFSDIGNTVCLQYKQIKPWADLITSHSVSGEGVILALKTCVGEAEEKGCFLVAELSCKGHLMSKDYSNATSKMAEDHSDFVVGLVCQSPEYVKVPHLIQLTPGVKLEETCDSLGQNYNDPESAVLEKGADIAVVGRGIISASDPKKAAIMYKEKLWNAYQKRIS